MIQIRPSDTIHTAHGGWFTARWHFSFDRYFVVHGAAEIGAEGAMGGTIDEGGAATVSGVRRVRFRALDEGAEILLVETRLR